MKYDSTHRSSLSRVGGGLPCSLFWHSRCSSLSSMAAFTLAIFRLFLSDVSASIILFSSPMASHRNSGSKSWSCGLARRRTSSWSNRPIAMTSELAPSSPVPSLRGMGDESKYLAISLWPVSAAARSALGPGNQSGVETVTNNSTTNFTISSISIDLPNSRMYSSSPRIMFNKMSSSPAFIIWSAISMKSSEPGVIFSL